MSATAPWWSTPTRPARPATRSHAAGHFKVHDLANIGDTDLNFITVEFLDSANKPLPVPD